MQNTYIRIVQGIDGGRTLAVTLPKIWTTELQVSRGDYVQLSKRGNAITIEKLNVND